VLSKLAGNNTLKLTFYPYPRPMQAEVHPLHNLDEKKVRYRYDEPRDVIQKHLVTTKNPFVQSLVQQEDKSVYEDVVGSTKKTSSKKE